MRMSVIAVSGFIATWPGRTHLIISMPSAQPARTKPPIVMPTSPQPWEMLWNSERRYSERSDRFMGSRGRMDRMCRGALRVIGSFVGEPEGPRLGGEGCRAKPRPLAGSGPSVRIGSRQPPPSAARGGRGGARRLPARRRNPAFRTAPRGAALAPPARPRLDCAPRRRRPPRRAGPSTGGTAAFRAPAPLVLRWLRPSRRPRSAPHGPDSTGARGTSLHAWAASSPFSTGRTRPT